MKSIYKLFQVSKLNKKIVAANLFDPKVKTLSGIYDIKYVTLFTVTGLQPLNSQAT